MTKSKASRILLRELAASLMDSFSCANDACEGEPPNRCPCGGDECWNCAAAQALDPPAWQRAALAARLKKETDAALAEMETP